ncbi:MAG: amidohydrolase family protein [Bacteroidota bacterium]
MKRTSLFLITGFILLSYKGFSQFITKYPEIPRIDVHTHVSNNYPGIVNYLEMRNALLTENKIDLAMWINLGGAKGTETGIDTIHEVSKGRVMTCISDYSPHRGLTRKPEEISGYLKKGFVGYKIWHGPASRVLEEGEKGIEYIDNLAHEPLFDAMEKAGMVMASVHIADPNGPFGERGKWCADPVEFWRSIVALERVLQRHPDLVIVAAHGSWLVCQDAQIDFLRYLLETYPNFHVDLAATFQYYHSVNQENLRDFFMEYSDRILYGTDNGIIKKSDIPNLVDRYIKTFQILETDDPVKGGFFGKSMTTGLNLPKDVLEKIYFKNAQKIYPGLKERMSKLEN